MFKNKISELTSVFSDATLKALSEVGFNSLWTIFTQTASFKFSSVYVQPQISVEIQQKLVINRLAGRPSGP